MSRAASLPGAIFLQKIVFFSRSHSFAAWDRVFFPDNRFFFEDATCPGQLRCLWQFFFQKIYFFIRSHLSWAASLPGAERFPENRLFFVKKPLVPGSFAAWGRFLSQIRIFFVEEATCPGQLRCLGQHSFSKHGLSGILGLLCAEQNVGNLKNELSGILGLLCADRMTQIGLSH